MSLGIFGGIWGKEGLPDEPMKVQKSTLVLRCRPGGIVGQCQLSREGFRVQGQWGVWGGTEEEATGGYLGYSGGKFQVNLGGKRSENQREIKGGISGKMEGNRGKRGGYEGSKYGERGKREENKGEERKSVGKFEGKKKNLLECQAE